MQQQQQQHVTNDGDGIATSSPLPPLPPLDANITTEGGGNSESTGSAAEAEAASATFDNSSSSSSNNNGLHYESEHSHHLPAPPLPQLPPPLPGNQLPPPPSQYSYSHYSQYPYSASPTEHHQQQQLHYPQQQQQLQQLQYPAYPSPPQQPIITNNNNNQPPINTDRSTYTFSIPTQDTQSLSNRQCYIRTHLIELFIANEEDVQSRPTKGRQKIYCGQVGIRCAYCVGAVAGNDNDGNNDNGSDGGDNTTSSILRPQPPPRAERAICYPQSISRIYQTVADMQRRHFEKCPYIPVVVMGTYKSLKSTRPRGENNPAHYWESSAREIGLIDSDGSSGSEAKVGIKGIVVDMERFSLQRKNVESFVVTPPGAATLGNTSTTAQEVDDNGKDYNDTVEQQPRATKRSRSTKEQEETCANSTQLQQQQPPQHQKSPPQSSNASSVSDAHLLASMRDGASSVTTPLNGVN